MTDHSSNPSAFQRHLPFFHRLVTSRRLWRTLGYAVLGLITLLALFFAVENWRGVREWNRVRAELVARGEPLTFTGLVPPMPPDDENFAMSPFFAGVLDKTIDPETGKPRWQLWQAKRKDQIRSQLSPLGLNLEGTWRLGERLRVVWREFELKQLATELGVPLITNEPFGVLRQLIARGDAELKEIEKALDRPHSQFPLHYEDNVSAILPHIGELKRLARLFTFRALASLDGKEPAAALADILTALRLADTIKNEPTLVSQLYREGMVNLALQPIWEGLAGRVWTEEQIRKLQMQLGTIDVLSGYQLGMRGERIVGTELAEIAEQERSYSRLGRANAPNYYPPSEQLEDRLIDLAPRGWYLHNKAFIARLLMNYGVPAVDPAGRRVYLDRAREYRSIYESTVANTRKLFIARLILPDVEKAVVRFANDQACLDQAVVACALERHRLATGRYPAELAALVPAYLPSLPNDLLDGQPLRYRREGDSFVLYSIGANETDDGGQVGFKELKKGRDWRRDEGDWVWSYTGS